MDQRSKMAGKNKKSANYLEFVPEKNDKFDYETDADGKITILKENTGLMNRIFQIAFKKPRISQIHLDEMGNFIWPLMDGERDVMAIAELVREEFGEKAEPLYERLSKYIQILESYGFVKVNKGLAKNDESGYNILRNKK